MAVLDKYNIPGLRALINSNASKLYGAALATSTKHSYKTGWKYYTAFLTKMKYPPVLNAAYLSEYICVRLETGVGVGTLCNDINGIIHYATNPDNAIKYALTDKDKYIDKLRTGFANLSKNKSVKFRYAFSISQLMQLIDKFYVKYGVFDAVSYHAALVVSFWCMLRSGEYCYKDNTRSPIHNCDISFIDAPTKYVKLTLWFTKTAQTNSQSVIASCKCATKGYAKICPYHILRQYMHFKQKYYKAYNKPDNFVFITINPFGKKAPIKPLRYRDWLSVLKDAAGAIGLNPAYVGTHCTRISGATALYNINVPPAIIQYLGRWKSNCWMHYIRIDNEKILNIVDKANSTNYKSVADDVLIKSLSDGYCNDPIMQQLSCPIDNATPSHNCVRFKMKRHSFFN